MLGSLCVHLINFAKYILQICLFYFILVGVSCVKFFQSLSENIFILFSLFITTLVGYIYFAVKSDSFLVPFSFVFYFFNEKSVFICNSIYHLYVFLRFLMSPGMQIYSGSLCCRLSALSCTPVNLRYQSHSSDCPPPLFCFFHSCVSQLRLHFFPRLRVSISLTHCYGCFLSNFFIAIFQFTTSWFPGSAV